MCFGGIKLKADVKAEKITYANDNARQAFRLVTAELIAYALTAIAFMACAVALTYTGLKESAVPVIVTVTCVVCVIVAGFDSARGARGKGWLWGLSAGLLYAVIFVFAGMKIASGFSFDSRTLILIALCAAGGAFGGVFGINFKVKNKSKSKK